MTQTKYFEIEAAQRAKVEQEDGKKYIYAGTPEAEALHNYFEPCSKRIKIGQFINVVFDQKPYVGGQRTHGTYHGASTSPALGPLYEDFGIVDWKGTLPITIIPECTMPHSMNSKWVDSRGLTHDGYHPPPQPLVGEEWRCQVITHYAYQGTEYAVVALKTKIQNAGESI